MANQRVLRIGEVMFLLAFCGSGTELPRIEAQAPSGLVQAPSTTGCRVSELVRAEPPRDPNADPFGQGPWYINANRSIWAGWDAGHWVSGSNGNKVLWIRPQGTNLKVVGRWLDGDGAMESDEGLLAIPRRRSICFSGTCNCLRVSRRFPSSAK
jgi:hypothetical protein